MAGPGGSPVEATYPLKANVSAGTYHCVLDAFIVGGSVDVQFDLIWRRGSTDTSLASWTAHYDPTPASHAMMIDFDEPAPAIEYAPGDLLVFRYTNITTASPAGIYTPNGDGPLAGARLPTIALPR